jgi:hypothetical protein
LSQLWATLSLGSTLGDVVARAADGLVLAGPSLDVIASRATLRLVNAGAGTQLIVAGAAEQAVLRRE